MQVSVWVCVYDISLNPYTVLALACLKCFSKNGIFYIRHRAHFDAIVMARRINKLIK